LALPAVRSDGGEAASAADRALVEAEVEQRRFSMASIRVLNVVVPSAEGALLSIVLSPSDLGTFAVARTVARPMTVVASAMVAVVSPGLVQRYDRGGARAVWSHMRRIIGRTVPIAFVLWGLGALAIGWAGPAVLSDYRSLVPVSVLLLGAGAVNLGTGPVGAGLQMSDGEAALLRITLFVSVAHLIVVAGLGFAWGVTAAAGGAVFSQLANNALCIRVLRPSRGSNAG
jgi:O-antigen/teichoic acid export membrane protein